MPIHALRSCRGAVALPTAIVLALVLLLVVLASQRGILTEQRSAVEHERAATAFEAAEAGVAWALARLTDPRPIDAACRPAAAGTPFTERHASAAAAGARPFCALVDAAWQCRCPAADEAPAPVEGAATAAFEVEFGATDRPGVLRIAVQGCAATPTARCADAGSDARSEIRAGWLPPLVRPPAAALTARGRIDGGAAPFGVHHASAESGGLTLHAGGAIAASAVRLTPPAGSLQADSIAAADASLGNETAEGFAARWFGQPIEALAQRSSRLVCPAGDCAPTLAEHIATTHSQRIVVDGDLEIASPLVLGTPERPLLLVATGAVRVTGEFALHGVLYAGALAWSAGTGPAARVHGATLVNGDVVIDAAPDFVHDAALLRRLARQAAIPVAVPGSWHDF